jgi:ketosteroid isomerase-like protein
MSDSNKSGGKTADLVRRCFAAYQAKDQAAIERLIAADFHFTSPYDDHIDRAAYFARCWPNAGKMQHFRELRLFAQGDEAFILYEARFEGTETFRNTEFFRTEGDQIKAVEVYFGEPAGNAENNEWGAGGSAEGRRADHGGSP